MRIRRLIVGVVALFTLAVPVAGQQPESPTLSRQQRAAMQALLKAIDTNSAQVSIDEADWPLHVLRASDGSHYVAFSLNRVEGLTTGRPVVLYVRLTTRRRGTTELTVERSAVAEWLAGQTPAPILPRRGLAFGEMPTYGAGGIAQRGATLQQQNLQILELERERAREKREAQERARKAALEGAETARAVRPLLPFEDFDFHALPAMDASGVTALRRSLTASPGDYDLTVAWMDADAAPNSGSVRVARRAVLLPPASATGLALSNVIVADNVTVREAPVAATEQTANPYSIGSTEIVPARDHVLKPDERLALVVQVINARGTPLGKPDVEVRFRVFRTIAGREENVGALAPQTYSDLTLPIDFDVTKGHPIFAAVAMPLRDFKRGDYRMEIAAHDRVAGAGVSTDIAFTVVATPAALLREAPPLAPVFHPNKESMSNVAVIRGGVHASDGNDREAIAAWQTAIDGGVDSAVVWPLMIDAALRLRDTNRAVELATRALAATPDHPRITRQLATAHVIAGRHDDALRLLDVRLQRDAGDLEAQWLTIYALFSGVVSGEGPGASAAGRTRLADLAARYAAAKGPHAALALDWAAAAVEGDHFFFGGGTGLPSGLSEYARRDATDTPGRSTFTSSWRTRFAASGLVE